MSATAFTLLWLGAVSVYLVWALPRLGPRIGVMLSASLALASLGAAAALSSLPWGGMPALALVFGHVGWALRGRADHEADTGTPIDPPMVEAGPAAPIAPPRPPGARLSLGRYRLVRELGRGAMGAVHLAHDPQLDRPVAIKTLALGREFRGADLADARARFRREAEAAARLQHPNIVTIFDAGEDDGLAFVAMEHLHGGDLVRHTRPGQLLPLATVLHIAEHVALALACAHRQGVIHRDVKPANVVFDADTGAVKVTDFGIASLGDALRTRTGVWLGTPRYMAPEQLTGAVLDGRADLYSLGVMLFQMLTGTLPHEAESMAELLRQIAAEPAPDIRTRRPTLPAALAQIVAQALEKQPSMRLADGRRMASELHVAAAQLAPEPAPAGTFIGPPVEPPPEL